MGDQLTARHRSREQRAWVRCGGSTGEHVRARGRGLDPRRELVAQSPAHVVVDDVLDDRGAVFEHGLGDGITGGRSIEAW